MQKNYPGKYNAAQLPRTCGDRPDWYVDDNNIEQFPPCLRG